MISKNSDRACPVAAVACFDRHVTKSRSLNFSPCLTDLIAQKSGAIFVYKIPYRRARAWPSGCASAAAECVARAKVSCIQALYQHDEVFN